MDCNLDCHVLYNIIYYIVVCKTLKLQAYLPWGEKNRGETTIRNEEKEGVQSKCGSKLFYAK